MRDTQESNITKALEHPNIVGFYYDNRWDIGDISGKLWSTEQKGLCFDCIKYFRDFLDMPYIRDIFEGDDESRTEWFRELANVGLYNNIRDVNIFRVNRLGSITFGESLLLDFYFGDNTKLLNDYKVALDKLIPWHPSSSTKGGLTRLEYNNMNFLQKKAHVYKMKECVFNFLDCLSQESKYLKD